MKITLLIAAVVLSACGQGAGVGNVKFTTIGSDGITAPIPADSAAKAGFVDGWVITYRKFLVIIKGTTIADSTGKVIFKQPNGLLYDLTRAGPFKVQDVTGVAVQKYDKVSYSIGYDSQFQLIAEAVTIPDATLMRNNAFGLYIEGNATKGALSKEFQWGFSLETLYENCEGGVTVTKDGTDTAELTIRGEHLFLDHLGDEGDAKLRFDAIAAADSATDGTITFEELNAVTLSSISGMPYDVGGSTEVKTLKDYVFASSRTLGHYRGDGECTSKAQ